ncbi:MAG TPA: endopeptidase La [Candidatus Gracilibacteria bacterium]|nr:endopeptidase La [Candidatus Gracilibacteria bacterium]
MNDIFPQGVDPKNYKLPLDLILIPLKDLVVFPSMVVTVYVRNEQLIQALSDASAKQELIGVVAQKDSRKPVPPLDNLFDVGTSVAVLQVIKGGNGRDAMALVEGISRFRIKEITQQSPFLKASIDPIKAAEKGDLVLQATLQELKEHIRKSASWGKPIPLEVLSQLEAMEDLDEVADITCSFLSIDMKKKQELLSIVDPGERIKKILEYMRKELELLKLRKKIHTDISQELNKHERDYLLRQEIKAIKKELGDGEEGGLFEGLTDHEDTKELKARIKAAEMPKDVEKIANQELERLKKIPTISPEYTVSRTYIEWLCDMPWNKSCPSKVDVKKARKILDEDHYGLEKIKERILEFLAVCQLNSKCGATILCFVGPPGVGKTSLGQSIARALGRKFVHTSLGGVRDEADIRGHRRTYVGALPGRIIQSLKRANCNDPVFMLDEIDKLSKDIQGDPASALLETLDPEQNFAFTDHYLDVPFDLSKVFFITTANVLDTIPPALLDRMEVIELPGYTEEEKLQIAKKYLLPRQLAFNGLEKHKFKMSDAALLQIIRYYTYEAGLRELERQIGALCRKIAKDLIEKNKRITIIEAKNVQKYLGVEQNYFEGAQEEDMVGVATGLAWTPYGGDIIFIEATRMKGSKNLILTGSLGDVMQESARAALSYVRSNAAKFKISDSLFERSDIHIHVPEGATPKDGPSAGITICTALISLLTRQKVRRDVAMTGEVTLTGRILPIGGLKEKILAAKRARIKTIIIPEKNRKDLAEIPKRLRKGITLEFAATLDEVIKIAIIPGKVSEKATLKKQQKEKEIHEMMKKKKSIVTVVPIPISEKKPIPHEGKKRK